MKLPKLLLIVCVFVLLANICSVLSAKNIEEDDDDFAEFDADDDDDEKSSMFKKKPLEPLSSIKRQPQPQKKLEVDDDEDFEDLNVVEEDDQSQRKDNEDENDDDENDVVVEDDDEFDDGLDDEFDDDTPRTEGKRRDIPSPKLTITPVAMPLRGLQAYWAELIMLSGILIYLANYIFGRYKNQNLAQLFFDINWSLLEDNFALIGDTTKIEDDIGGTRNFTKMSDSLYQMWCSGRICCEGMLVELKLLKRQDIISLISNIFRPQKDVIRLSIEMSKEDMEPIVFYLGQKKVALKTSKEYNDLINFCGDKRPTDKFGLSSNNFLIYSELAEVLSGIMDQRTISILNKYSTNIESIHFTDQFTGLKSQEPELNKDGIMEMPKSKLFLFFTFLLDTTSTGGNADEAIDQIKPLIQFAIQTIDRVKRFRLSKEGKMKADKNRAKVEELFLKQTLASRAEAVAAKREEKRRQERERILLEDDPEKQRKMELKLKKEEKKKPKIKQLKVKAM